MTGLAPALARRVAGYPTLARRRPGRPIAACDLDRTLIYSAAALGLSGPDAGLPRLVVTEMHHGAPLTFCTRTADTLIAELRTVAHLVPVTTRTVAQYQRIRLVDGPLPYAVTSNGGRILVDGRCDEDWSRAVTGRIADGCAPLDEVRAHVTRTADPLWLRRLRTADDLFCYAIVERSEIPDPWVAELGRWCAGQGWQVSLQGRKLYCVPAPLTKSGAVTEIAGRLGTGGSGAGPVLAAGDSLLDLDLLVLADAAVRPAHGELHQQGWRPDHVTVTDTSGVLAGEEILARLLAYAYGPAD
ncbi:hypothetical protein ACWKSP_27960 [Micromonosporaceae bacterium Da 78-11]